MDVDTFVKRNSATWARLDQLAGMASMHPTRMKREDVEQLVTLYGQVSTHLSYLRTHISDPRLKVQLSALLARAGASIHGSRPRTRRSLSVFFGSGLPAAVWEIRPFVAASALLTFVPAILIGLWLSHSPSAVHSIAPSATVRHYVNSSFSDYYRSEPAIEFATHVYLNNVLVSFEAFALGLFLCVPTAFVLVVNGINLGVAAGLLTAAGKGVNFWVLVVPHGLVELTSVVLAGAAGMSLGWALVAPGDRSRSLALRETARRSVSVLFGVAITLAVAGAIEGTVSGSSLPPELRIGIGVLAEGALLTYLIAIGTRSRAAPVNGVERP